MEAASITVADDRDVTWPDASLGCPEPGTRYIQRLTEGRLVVLECAGTRHEYHGGPDGTLAYCAVPAPPAHG